MHGFYHVPYQFPADTFGDILHILWKGCVGRILFPFLLHQYSPVPKLSVDLAGGIAILLENSSEVSHFRL
jgi:hypothetical protein